MTAKEKKQELVSQEFEKLPAEVRANMLSSEKSIFFNVALFEQAQRIAKMFADSTMVPEHFQRNIGNCMIGLNYAMRLQADPFMVLQCLYIVHGRPGVEGKLIEAVINQSAKYSQPLEYEWLDPEDKAVERRTVLNHKDFGEFGCQAFSIDAKSGKRVDGPKITWKLIKAEGWWDKKGSKWQTMPEMMFIYRAASWFSNKNCPELKLGMHTVEELQDIVDLGPKQNGSYGVTDAASDLNDKLKAGASGEKKGNLCDPKETKPEEKEEKKEEEKPDPIRKLYKGLGDKKFREFVNSHRDAIPAMPQKYQDEIHKSWKKRFKDEPYPVNEEPKTPTGIDPNLTADRLDEEPTTETDHGKILRLVDGSEMDEGMGQSGIPCPTRDENTVASNWCQGEGNCKERQGCPSWKKYDAEGKE